MPRVLPLSCERHEDGQKVDLDVDETLGEDGGDALGDRGDGGDRGDRLCEARCDTMGDERGWSRQAAGRRQRMAQAEVAPAQLR